nr:hypothetical protein [Mycobacterium sp. E3298]
MRMVKGLSLDTWFLDSIKHKKRGHKDAYIETLKEVFGSEMSWEELSAQESNKHIEVMCLLEEKIKLKQSPIDVKKMAYAIQHSRSGIGGAAITKYICAFCGVEEMWSNTATPKICLKCATKMAKNIAMTSPDKVLKEGYGFERLQDK